jgi:hypothetical protein
MGRPAGGRHRLGEPVESPASIAKPHVADAQTRGQHAGVTVGWKSMEFSLERATEVLRGTPDVLRALLGVLFEEWITGDGGPGTWSPYQVVGHLTHVDEHDWIDRTRVILEHGTERRQDDGQAVR